MIFIVILLAEEQFVRSIDIVEIQCCLVLEIGGILPLLPFDRIAVKSIFLSGKNAARRAAHQLRAQRSGSQLERRSKGAGG